MATGRVILITGAARGLGKAMALRFAREPGVSLVLADKLKQKGEVAAREARTIGAKSVAFVACDVARLQSARELLCQVARRFGRLDVVIPNAGILKVGPVGEVEEKDLRAVFETNAIAAFRLLQAALPLLTKGRGPLRDEKDGGACVLFISSVAALIGLKQTALYSASKAALLGLTRSAAVELADCGVRVNALCPSLCDTAMIRDELEYFSAQGGGRPSEILEKFLAAQPINRLIKPEEVAEVAWFLCSPSAAMITGQAIALDGGLLAR
ncbi:MAG: SDR family oxidoreductase [bacterium]